MNKGLAQELVSQFVQSYDSVAKDKIWQKQSADFRRFWSERVLAPGKGTISNDDCDVIIRILDFSSAIICLDLKASPVPPGGST